jgi:hypothetical protein
MVWGTQKAECPGCSRPVRRIFFNAHACPDCGARLDIDNRSKCLLAAGVIVLMVTCIAMSRYVAADSPNDADRICKILFVNGLAVAVFWIYYAFVMRFGSITKKPN